MSVEVESEDDEGDIELDEIDDLNEDKCNYEDNRNHIHYDGDGIIYLHRKIKSIKQSIQNKSVNVNEIPVFLGSIDIALLDHMKLSKKNELLQEEIRDLNADIRVFIQRDNELTAENERLGKYNQELQEYGYSARDNIEGLRQKLSVAYQIIRRYKQMGGRL